MSVKPISFKGKETEIRNRQIADIRVRWNEIERMIRDIYDAAFGGSLSKAPLSGELLATDSANENNLYEKVKQFEVTLIVEALIKCRGKQRTAAKLLGINTSTLNSKIKRYNIAAGSLAVQHFEDFIRRGN
jgi:DNA-binding protein Fis